MLLRNTIALALAVSAQFASVRALDTAAFDPSKYYNSTAYVGACVDSDGQQYDTRFQTFVKIREDLDFDTDHGDFRLCAEFCQLLQPNNLAHHVGLQFSDSRCYCLYEDKTAKRLPTIPETGSNFDPSGTGVVVGGKYFHYIQCHPYFGFGEPWSIIFDRMEEDFSSVSDGGLRTIFRIDGRRNYTHALYAGPCEEDTNTNITGLELGTDYNVTDTTTTYVQGGTLDILQLSYSFDKSKLWSSNIWNSTSNMIKLCNVVQLTLDGGVTGLLVPALMKVDIDVTYNFMANYEAEGNVTLDPTIIDNENENTILDGFLEAFQCTKDGDPSKMKLFPNAELHLCFKSQSSDVNVEEIETMNIVGFDSNQQEQTLPVIADSQPFYGGEGGFTSIAYPMFKKDSIIVTTRIPFNMYNYNDGAQITVSGVAIVMLAGPTSAPTPAPAIGCLVGAYWNGTHCVDTNTGRMLQLAADSENEEAYFNLKVDLKGEQGEGMMATMSSAKATVGNSIFIIGMVMLSILW